MLIFVYTCMLLYVILLATVYVSVAICDYSLFPLQSSLPLDSTHLLKCVYVLMCADIDIPGICAHILLS